MTLALTADAPAGASLNVTVSPLQWFCGDDAWENVPLADDACSWEGASVAAAYALDVVVVAGLATTLRLDPDDNATLYPAPWYDSPSLYLRVVGPLENASAIDYTILIRVGDERACGVKRGMGRCVRHVVVRVPRRTT